MEPPVEGRIIDSTSPIYATSRTLIVPYLSRRTVKGNSAVVMIGVRRRGVGSDNATCWQAEGGDFPNFALTAY